MKKKYDMIFSMGAACSCSQALREAGLQFASFPFDWVVGPGICFRAQMIADDFPGWLEPETFIRVETPKFSTSVWYRDKFGFSLIHDFHVGVPFDEELPLVRAKYRRRIDRLSRLLDSANRALVVYIESGGAASASADDAVKVRETLARRWPCVDFDVLLVKYREGVPFSRRSDETGEGWRFVQYDFKDRREDEWRVDWRQVARWLRKEYEVVDYRTAEEKAQWKSRARKREYAEFKATNWWGYAVTKIQYKIYKHLRKRLLRKGIV